MQAIEKQHDRCKSIFVQYRVLVPILAALIVGMVVASFSFGQQLKSAELKVEKVEKIYGRLINIETAIDSLLKKD